ncbi:MAG: hypothetical protein RKR03_03500 [Candidatus Competibacter sp.]|nr:hypothetical protein [Candidatus Competibacter sp.]
MSLTDLGNWLMTDEDDTRQPRRLPSLESGLPFRERGRLGKLPEKATGPEWATMLAATGYGSGAWWRQKIARAIRQRDLNTTTGEIIRRDEMLRWLEEYGAVPDKWRTPIVPVPQGAAIAPAPLPQGEPDKPEQGAAESSRKRKRVDALAEAIDAALEVLSPDGRLPTPVRLFEYLLTQDTTGVVIPGDSKTVFYWIASNGNKQSADFSTIAKRLDRMKQGG